MLRFSPAPGRGFLARLGFFVRTPLTSARHHFLSGFVARHALRLAAVTCLTAAPGSATASATATAATVTAPFLIKGRVFDVASREPLVGVLVRLFAPATDSLAAHVFTDSAGHFALRPVADASWRLRFHLIGYEPVDLDLPAGTDTAQPLAVTLRVRPLLMDELTVRAQRADAESRSPAFVEVITVDQGRAGMDLPVILDQAVGVKTRRYGGLGSFSTVSIRGSTAEQVQVYLDGVPLNQAVGGGVDLGNLPIAGIESIEVYRGAIPARFGGNSIGGVVHVRTRKATGDRQFRLRAAGGSFGTRQLSASAGGRVKTTQVLGLADFSSSENDFRFLNHNATDINTDDDTLAVRRNSDFRSFRTLVKLNRQAGGWGLKGQHILDIAHRGIPGVGWLQAENVRFDTWGSTTELEAFGVVGATGYRATVHHLEQQGEFKDPGKVGLRIPQHERNKTVSVGSRLEANRLMGRALTTAFASFTDEGFDPVNLLDAESRLLDSGRRTASGGAEFELPALNDRAQIIAGSQVQWIDDKLYADGPLPMAPQQRRSKAKAVWGARLGGRFGLGSGWVVKGHGGRYGRAPSFYELFGDRGAVIGDADLETEEGTNLDMGLVFRPGKDAEGSLRFFEAVVYQKVVHKLIWFVFNSQRVARPENIGEACIRGLEVRGRVRVGGIGSVSGNYAYQVAINRSSKSFWRGRELPNAPRHNLNARAEVGSRQVSMNYEVSAESRHFYDRTNKRPAPRRIVHSLGGHGLINGNTELSWEIRNLTANQVVDLWGYPLPGRSYFVAVKQDFASTRKM